VKRRYGSTSSGTRNALQNITVRSFWMLNRLVNPWVRGLLRSPLHPVVSQSLLLLEYRGKTSGRLHRLPVQYVEHEDEIVVVVGSPDRKRWWRNLRPEAPVRILRRGQWLSAHAYVLEGDVDAIAPRLERYLKQFPRAARYQGLAADEPGILDRPALPGLAGRTVLVRIAVPAG
jgi:deazaflavin-dependent oxidoreductase (nitroreductase family)